MYCFCWNSPFGTVSSRLHSLLPLLKGTPKEDAKRSPKSMPCAHLGKMPEAHKSNGNRCFLHPLGSPRGPLPHPLAQVPIADELIGMICKATRKHSNSCLGMGHGSELEGGPAKPPPHTKISGYAPHSIKANHPCPSRASTRSRRRPRRGRC